MAAGNIGGLTLGAGIAAAIAMDQQGAAEIANNASLQIEESNVRQVNNRTVGHSTEGANYTQTETQMNNLENQLASAESSALGVVYVQPKA